MVQPGGKNNEQTEFRLEVLRWIKKHNVDIVFQQSVSSCKQHWDAALMKDLAFYRSHQHSAAEWWDQRKDEASVLLPKAETNICFAPNTKGVSIIKELKMVAQSSGLGKKLVGKALRDAAQEQLSKIVDDMMLELMDVDLTEEILAEHRTIFCSR